jgi:N-methylhydantoinase B/oxoprolinase/acetone carboxylase alpha subunit
MSATLMRTAFSPNIKERADCSTAIFDAQGQVIALAQRVPVHLGSMVGAVAAIRERYGVEDTTAHIAAYLDFTERRFRAAIDQLPPRTPSPAGALRHRSAHRHVLRRLRNRGGWHGRAGHS